jgi:tyrosine-protein phosphatase SIW14
MKLPLNTKRIVASLGLLFTVAICIAAEQRGLPASEGILNFGKVNEMLYRGAQPDDAAIVHLKSLGIKTIISLRTTKEAATNEAAQAIASGITYTNIPLAGLGRPTDSDVLKILSLIEESPGPVFVHCEHGCDRTGTIIACYRLQHDHWTGEAALEEANRYGMSHLERGMRFYVRDFAKTVNAKTNTPLAAKP